MLDQEEAYATVYKIMGGVERKSVDELEIYQLWNFILSRMNPICERNSLHVREAIYEHDGKTYVVAFPIGSSLPFSIDMCVPMKKPAKPKASKRTSHQRRIEGYQVEIDGQPVMVADLTVEQLQSELCLAIDTIENLDALTHRIGARISKWRSPPPKPKKNRSTRHDPAFGIGRLG